MAHAEPSCFILLITYSDKQFVCFKYDKNTMVHKGKRSHGQLPHNIILFTKYTRQHATEGLIRAILRKTVVYFRLNSKAEEFLSK